MESNEELALDLDELKHLQVIAKRPRIVSLISNEICDLEKLEDNRLVETVGISIKDEKCSIRLTTRVSSQFMNRTFADFPWQVHVEVDGVEIEVPEDAEGVLVANIGSYMGGVDLWQNEDESYDNFDPQSMHDKVLEVVSISSTWHLVKLQVGLSRARRPAQGQSIKIQLFAGFSVQVDGQPWFQQPCALTISHHGQVNLVDWLKIITKAKQSQEVVNPNIQTKLSTSALK